ncbi:hypothetical protein IV40_GL000915 [Lactobacillus selangorensis]|uniref:Class B sortase n=1 Tax=Lactobacillus selangorensis TaxID=81857 RepID=A0A0R2FXJ1_9LACO|nr:hypothetical protein IV40_GL000915 [Lactobacillus selangorensis]
MDHEKQTTAALAKRVTQKRPAAPHMPAEGRLKINWTKLQQVNPRIKAWIYIPGTHINEPILQGPDNDFYLHHDERNQASILGQIFMDYRNQADFADQNTFIYGHYTHSGERFADLDHYLNQSFLNKHPHVYLYTPTHQYVGTVFAVQSNSAFSQANTHKFTNRRQFSAYLAYLKKHSTVKTKQRTKTIHKVATLWTCTEQATTDDSGTAVSADKARTFVSVSLKKASL